MAPRPVRSPPAWQLQQWAAPCCSIAAASGHKQLRLKIGPDTGKKTPLQPELAT